VLATPEGGLAEVPAALAERTGFLVARAHFVLRGLGKAQMAPLGIEPPHFAALAIVDDIGPSSQQRLAGQLGVTGTLVVQIVDHLEAQGLVERRRSPDDRRAHQVTLTETGKRALADGYAVVEQLTGQFTEPLGPDGAEELRELLLRLLSGAGAS
jgi:DNA-binding MarR family transcriptional regulator